MRALIILLVLAHALTAADERFTLKDGRVLVGTYDETTRTLSFIIGAVPGKAQVDPSQIVSREPIKPPPTERNFVAEAAALDAQQKAIEAERLARQQREAELAKQAANAREAERLVQMIKDEDEKRKQEAAKVAAAEVERQRVAANPAREARDAEIAAARARAEQIEKDIQQREEAERLANKQKAIEARDAAREAEHQRLVQAAARDREDAQLLQLSIRSEANSAVRTGWLMASIAGFLPVAATLLMLCFISRLRRHGVWLMPVSVLVGTGGVLLTGSLATLRIVESSSDSSITIQLQTLFQSPRHEYVVGHNSPMLLEGGLSDSGRWHGRWTINDRYQWYWYGEKISEGEWHLRNK